MFKNMKLGTKISVGFGLLILIACLLGSLAVYNMKNVEGQSTVLAKEYVPEVALANEVERSSLATMYAIRGYNFTEEDEYLKTAREHFSHLTKKLEECKELSKNSTQLVKLEGYAENCLKNSREYERLTNEVEKKNKGIAESRNELDSSAATYMQNCNDFLAGQNTKMEEDIKAKLDEAKLDERMEKITIVNDIIDVGNATRIAAFKSQALRSPKIIQDAQKNFTVMAEKFASLRKITRSADDIKRIDETEDAASRYKSAMNSLLENWIAVQELAKQQDVAGEAVLEGARSTATAGIEGTTEIADAAVASLGTSSTIMITGLIVALVVGVLLAFFITRSIVGPISRIISGLTEGSEQVGSAAGQVSAASQSLAEGATEQAAGLEETSSSLEEMASMTKQNADNAQQASTLAATASKAANTGNEKMAKMGEAIQDIQKSSDKTAKIIKVIDEIAFQTNLLALNAAVEAARAGEAGKGFAVVAEEVRNLAMRSAEAAKDTSAMIEESVKNANNGVEIATEVAKVLGEIVEGISKTTDLVGEIAAASQEQSQGIDQVNTAVSQMDKVTQANAANAEESASASEELSAQAEQMNGIVAELSALVGGNSQVNAGSSARTPRRTLNTSDHAFHQIANGSAKAQASQSKAEKIIPLGNSNDFEGFNS